MIRYVKSIDELVDMVDRDFSGKNAVCPICKNKIGSVNIPNVELGVEELKFTHFKYPGVYCTEGHCVISLEEALEVKKDEEKKGGDCRIYIEDVGIKVFEVMKLIKPYLGIDKSVPNTEVYWMLMNKNNPVYMKDLSHESASEILDKLQTLGARAYIA